MSLCRAVMVLGVVGAPHGGAAEQGLAARAHPISPARDTRTAPGPGSHPGHGLRLSQAMGPQVESSSAKLWGPGDQSCCGITGESFPGR